MPEIILSWAMQITLFNPATDTVGQYKYFPFATKVVCEEKIAAHMKTHALNGIPNRYVRGDCVVYQVRINWTW